MADEHDDKIADEAAKQGAQAVADDDFGGDELLTDEEREALGLSDDADADAGDAEGDGAGGDDGAAQAASDEGDAGGGAKDDDADVDADLTKIPDLGEIKARLDAMKADKDALFEKFNDGEMDDAELREKLDALTDEAADLKAQQKSVEDMKSKWMDRWKGTVRDYLAEYPDLGADDHVDSFDSIVRAINASDDPRIQALSMRKRLELAHDRYLADAATLGIEAPKRQPAAKKEAEPALPPKGEKPRAPVTVRTIPQSDQMSAVDGKWAALDKILESGDADAIEAALSKLSPEERDAYNAAA